jgi:hypothetical protein
MVMFCVPLLGAQRPGDTDQVRSRQRISMMEGMLERAVSNGADDLLREVRAFMPDPPRLSGAPEVRGFRIEGYGVFFDVEVPALLLPITWSLRSVIDDRGTAAEALAGIRALLGQLSPRERERAEPMFTELELQLGLAQSGARRGAAGAPVADTVSVQPAAVPPGRTDPRVVEDPNVAYTKAVKAALLDAMLEYGGSLNLAADEWLAIAARDNIPENPLIPGDAADFSTVIFRIKGGDLAAYRAGRLTPEEARGKVETREY